MTNRPCRCCARSNVCCCVKPVMRWRSNQTVTRKAVLADQTLRVRSRSAVCAKHPMICPSQWPVIAGQTLLDMEKDDYHRAQTAAQSKTLMRFLLNLPWRHAARHAPDPDRPAESMSFFLTSPANVIDLGVNIDHVATLRNARGTHTPIRSAPRCMAEEAGADAITLHLREDRRHIVDADVQALRPLLKTRMNLECAVTQEMLDIACGVQSARRVPRAGKAPGTDDRRRAGRRRAVRGRESRMQATGAKRARGCRCSSTQTKRRSAPRTKPAHR